jgi:menaquinone-specific isochorismate synthase
MLTNQAFVDRVIDVIALRPDHVWVEPGMAMFGWGTEKQFEVGTGPERYGRAQEAARTGNHQTVFASFTFDLDDPESFVVAPSTVVRVDHDSIHVLQGEMPTPSVELPRRLPEMIGSPRTADGWEHAFEEALSRLRASSLEKVVLSRTVEISFDHEIEQGPVIEQLVRDQAGSFVFAADGLIGSSPELLARLDGTAVESVSLAGSMARDQPNGALSSAKNRREHELAADSVASALRSVTTSLTRGDTNEASFADIVHLATGFEGQAVPGTAVLDLIGRLHPTAAVAGTPTAQATRLIRDIEKHRRGRYAGPVGWFDSSGNGTFAIALRCGLIRGRHVTLFTGAGLVEGSEADSEYAETEIKLIPMLRSLGLS